MNLDRLRIDLADLAEEVAPVDLRDRTLRTSHRLGVQRTLASSAAALVMIGAATGTAYAFRPSNHAGPEPADSTPPAVVQTTTPPTAAANPSQTGQVPEQPAGLETGFWYYVGANSETGKNVDGMLWHLKPGGQWQVSKTNTNPNPSFDFFEVASPDGRLLTWYDNSSMPKELRVSNIDGSNARTLATFTEPTCLKPAWTDGSSRITFGTGQVTTKIETIGVDGTGRKVMDQQGSCDGIAASEDGSTLAYVLGGKIGLTETDQALKRMVNPQIPAGLVVHDVAALSADGKRAVVGTHVPTPGECGCNWQIRNFLVDLGSGASVELDRMLGPDSGREGTGWLAHAVFLPSGGVVAQVNLASIGDDQPAYSLGTFSAAGKLTGTTQAPPDTVYGELVTYQP
jgi:hypothetical protein